MASKKIKKALGAALLGFGAAKAMGAIGAKKAAIKAAQVDTGDFGNQMDNDTNLVKGTAKALLSKSKKAATMVPKKKPVSSRSDKMYNLGNAFGLGPYDGAKKGKMIKARGGKMVNLKPTKLY